MSFISVCKNLVKAQGMMLVVASSGVLLTGCGAGTADGTYTVEVQTAENGTTGITVTPPTTTPTEPAPTTPTEPAHALSLTSQPSSASVFEGQSQTFTLGYSNSHPVTVSWYKNGALISGATGNSYTIASATTGSAGNYTCAVTDGTLTANCSTFALTVNQIVKITQQPSNQILNEGLNATLSVTATGTGPLSYQWYFNNQAMTGKTTAQLSLTGITKANEGQYKVVVTNAGSNATSNVASLSVIANPIGKAQLNWQAPTKRADGSNLAANEISGYEVFYSTSASGEMTKLTTTTAAELSLLVDELATGTHYFALTTVDTSGAISSKSSRFSVAIQ